MWSFPLFPESASTIAGQIDSLYFGLVLISLFFSLVIVVGLVYSAVRYRKGSKATREGAVHDSLKLELAWSLIPLAIAMGIFAWSATLYFKMHVAPRDSMEIYVVAKQWMWKIQHPNGNSEINTLHVPMGIPVKLVMTSQDVIHSFYIPAFRIKQDVLPGRYTTQWFEATKPGEYHLFCAEYCGTSHASMIGKVVVMEQVEYEQWLTSTGRSMTMALSGGELFKRYGCQTCHKSESGMRGPTLAGLYGSEVTLQTGKAVTADVGYIRESIINPGAKLAGGYQNLMPTYKNQVTEEELNQLVEYIKTLAVEEVVTKR